MNNLRILLLSLLIFATQSLQASEIGGPATQDQLIGFWKMKTWPKPEMNQVNPWPLQYQWFSFEEDGRIKSMMSSEDGDYSAEELTEIFSTLPPESPTYQLQGQFMVVLHPQMPDYDEVWGVNVFTSDYGSAINKGDLLMSLAGGADGNPVYYRLLEKLD